MGRKAPRYFKGSLGSCRKRTTTSNDQVKTKIRIRFTDGRTNRPSISKKNSLSSGIRARILNKVRLNRKTDVYFSLRLRKNRTRAQSCCLSRSRLNKAGAKNIISYQVPIGTKISTQRTGCYILLVFLLFLHQL